MLNKNNDIIVLNEDVICVILIHINDTKTYMHCLSLCTTMYSFLMKTHEDKIVSFNLGIIGLYKRYPDLQWNKSMFSSNPSVRIKDIISYPEIFKSGYYATFFSSINDKYGYLKYKDDFPLHVVEEIISNNPEFHLVTLFTFIRFFNNRYIDFSTKITIPHSHVDFRFNGMTIMELGSLEEFNDINLVSGNPNVTMKIVFDNPNFKWCWNLLSCNKSITVEDVILHPQFDWDYQIVIMRGTIKEYFKYRHLFNLNVKHIFNQIKVNIEDFTLYPDLLQLVTSFDLSRCCMNNYLAPDILNHFKLPIDYYYLSLNKNITMDCVLKNMDKNWNWSCLSATLFK